MPNREFSGDVNAEMGTVVIRRPSTNDAVLISIPAATLLHESLFGGDTVPAEWVRLPEDKSAAGEALRRVLGPDLLPYAVGQQLPPTGQATAIAFLEVSRRVERDGNDAVGGTATERFRIDVDRDRYDEELKRFDALAAGDDLDEPPTIFVWVSNADRVVQVEVRPPPDERSDEPPAGWTIEYAPLGRDEAPRPTGIVELAISDLEALGPPLRTTCELPL